MMWLVLEFFKQELVKKIKKKQTKKTLEVHVVVLNFQTKLHAYVLFTIIRPIHLNCNSSQYCDNITVEDSCFFLLPVYLQVNYTLQTYSFCF